MVFILWRPSRPVRSTHLFLGWAFCLALLFLTWQFSLLFPLLRTGEAKALMQQRSLSNPPTNALSNPRRKTLRRFPFSDGGQKSARSQLASSVSQEGGDERLCVVLFNGGGRQLNPTALFAAASDEDGVSQRGSQGPGGSLELPVVCLWSSEAEEGQEAALISSQRRGEDGSATQLLKPPLVIHFPPATEASAEQFGEALAGAAASLVAADAVLVSLPFEQTLAPPKSLARRSAPVPLLCSALETCRLLASFASDDQHSNTGQNPALLKRIAAHAASRKPLVILTTDPDNNSPDSPDSEAALARLRIAKALKNLLLREPSEALEGKGADAAAAESRKAFSSVHVVFLPRSASPETTKEIARALNKTVASLAQRAATARREDVAARLRILGLTRECLWRQCKLALSPQSASAASIPTAAKRALFAAEGLRLSATRR